MTVITLTKPDMTTEDRDITFPFYMNLTEPMIFAGILTFDIRVEESGAVTNVMTFNLNGDQVQVNAMNQDVASYISMYIFNPMYEESPDSTAFDTAYAAAIDRFTMTP